MNIPLDIHSDIFIFLCEANYTTQFLLYTYERALAKSLRYFRISKETYNLRESIILRYNVYYAQLFSTYIIGPLVIPTTKNAYLTSLMHYFKYYKLTTNAGFWSKFSYKYNILIFAADNKRKITQSPYIDDLHAANVIKLCEGQSLSTCTIKKCGRLQIKIYK